MPLEDADTYRFDPFDVTKVWSQKDYPLIELGRMELNRNPENYFAEVEQATFSPGTFVPGIEASRIKCFKVVYSHMVMHTVTVWARTITSFRLTVQKWKRTTINVMAQMRADGNGGGSVYYEPNSFGGPTESPEHKATPFAVTGSCRKCRL